MQFLLLIFVVILGLGALGALLSADFYAAFMIGLLTAGLFIVRQRRKKHQRVRKVQQLYEQSANAASLLKKPEVISDDDFGISVTVTNSYSNDEPMPEWIPFDQSFNCKGYELSGGFYFADSSSCWGAEPSTITKKDLVGEPVEPHIFTASYYPSYVGILPNERATFLQWLAGLAQDVHPPTLARGYIFLHFYGLERRALVDGDSDDRIIDTVEALLENYGPYNQGRTLIGYLTDFICFASYQRGQSVFRARWPRLLLLQGARLSEDSLSLILANLFERQETLDAELAFRIAQLDDRARQSVVVKRSGEKFRVLFEKKYTELYPDGLGLKVSQREKVVRYRAANRSLLSGSYSNEFSDGSGLSLRVPNVFGIKSQFKKLPDIWNQCIDELSSYSRAVRAVVEGHDQCRESQLKAYLALPEALRQIENHPMAEDFSTILSAGENLSNLIIVSVSSLAGLSGIEKRTTLTARQSQNLASLIESFGYSCSPHPLHMGLPFKWEQELVLHAGMSHFDGKCAHLTGVLRLLYLTVIVAAADGEIDEAEINHFKEKLEGMEFDTYQKDEIYRTLIALERDSNIALRSLNKISKNIPKEKRSAVLSHLISVATEDDMVTKEEFKVLKRIAKAMELSSDQLEKMVDEISQFKTVEVDKGKPSARKGEALPVLKKTDATSTRFTLDKDKIDSISEETESVVAILSEVLSEAEDNKAVSIVAEETESTQWLEDLDGTLHIPLTSLISLDNPSMTDLDQIAKQHHLITDSMVDSINEWSDEALGDFLIEVEADGSANFYHDLLPQQLKA